MSCYGGIPDRRHLRDYDVVLQRVQPIEALRRSLRHIHLFTKHVFDGIDSQSHENKKQAIENYATVRILHLRETQRMGTFTHLKNEIMGHVKQLYLQDKHNDHFWNSDEGKVTVMVQRAVIEARDSIQKLKMHDGSEKLTYAALCFINWY